MATKRDDSRGFQPVRTTSIELYEVPEKEPSSYLALSVVATIFNLVFGAVALVLSCSSISARTNGNYKVAKQKGKSAMIVSIVGILVSCLLAIFLVVYFVVIAPDEQLSVTASEGSNGLPNVWRQRMKTYTRPYWCESYGYNSWWCKGPL